jgi:dicarboxylate/amino acid:cation (Na+ or H+) symporter, DAACS family
VHKLGRVGLITLAYTVIVSGISVAIGIVLVNLFHPGRGVDATVRGQLEGAFFAQSQSAIESAKQAKHWTDALLSLIPRKSSEWTVSSTCAGRS